MNETAKPNVIHFSVKGQVVIPRWLRRHFEIEEGTRAMVEGTPQGILIRPVTLAAIRRARGILKRKPGEKPFTQEWAEHKKREKALEEAKHARTGPR